MTQSLRFVVLGPPVPKERARSGKGGRHYTPERTREYEEHVRVVALAETRERRWDKLTANDIYNVTMHVYHVNRARRDLTNVAKAIEDACNGVVWEDDSQIHSLYLLSDIDRVRPRVEVVVERMCRRRG